MHPSIPVNVYDLDGNFLVSYESAGKAAEYLDLNRNHVLRCLRRGYGRAGQYQVRYKSPEEDSLWKKNIDSYKADRLPKMVDVYDLDGNFLASYESINKAVVDLRLCKCQVIACLKKGSGRAGQYQIRYRSPEEDTLGQKIIDSYKTVTSPKKVDVFDLNGKYIMTCQSIREASRILHLPASCIRDCVKGKFHRAGQYMFRNVKKPRGKANAASEDKPYLVRVDYFESKVRTGILYRLVPYTGENRCVKCAFANDEHNCLKAKCTTPDGQNGYFRFYCEADRKDYFVAQV